MNTRVKKTIQKNKQQQQEKISIQLFQGFIIGAPSSMQNASKRK